MINLLYVQRDSVSNSTADLAKNHPETSNKTPDWDTSFTYRLRRRLFRAASRIAPQTLADRLAYRYVCSSRALIEDLDPSHYQFKIKTIESDMAILRHDATASKANDKRILVVPGHDGHYRQFIPLIRELNISGVTADFVVLPGHMYRKRSVCSLQAITEAILRATEAYGPYEGLIAHCVSANAAILALRDGLICPKVALISTPLELAKLVRMGGAQYALSGQCLDLFMNKVAQLGAWQHISPWREIAPSRTEKLLLIHAEHDYVAPVNDLDELHKLWPNAELNRFEYCGHNSILNKKRAVSRTVSFFTEA